MRFMERDGFDLAGECDATDPERFKAAVEAVEALPSEELVDQLARKRVEDPRYRAYGSSYGPSPEEFREEAMARREAAWNSYWGDRVTQDQIDAEKAAYEVVVKRANEAANAILREGLDAVRAYKGRTNELERIREGLNEAEYRFRVATAKAVEARFWTLVKERNAEHQRREIERLRTEGVLPVPMPVVRDWRRSEHVVRRGGTEAILVLKHDRSKGYRSEMKVRTPAQSWPVVEVQGAWQPTREGAVDALRRKVREMGVVTDPTHLTV